MKKIPLTQGKFAIVDDEDYAELSKHKWYALKVDKTWYAYRGARMPNNKMALVAMHRQILNAPKGSEVDHMNHNGLNNKRDNIQICSKGQNQANQNMRGGTSVFKGVYWHKSREEWRAQIKHNRKNICLGSFSNEVDAAKAYDKKAKELFGEFALTNAAFYL